MTSSLQIKTSASWESSSSSTTSSQRLLPQDILEDETPQLRINNNNKSNTKTSNNKRKIQMKHDQCLLMKASSSVQSILTSGVDTSTSRETEDPAGGFKSSSSKSDGAHATSATPHQCIMNANALIPSSPQDLGSFASSSGSFNSTSSKIYYVMSKWVNDIARCTLQLTTSPNVIPVSILGQYLLVLLYSWYFLDYCSFAVVAVTCLIGGFKGRKYIKVFSRDSHLVPTTVIEERNRLIVCLILFSIRYYFLSQMKIVIIPLYFISVMTTTILRRNSLWWSIAPMLFVFSQFIIETSTQLLREGWNAKSVQICTENLSFVIVILLFTFFTITTGMNLKSKLNKLEQTSEQLEQALSAKQTFLRHISHEFRTPCLSSLGSVELLKETTLTEYQRDLVETIASADGILLNLIEDILTLAKIEHEKKLEEKEEIVDTSKYVQEFSLGHCVKMIGNIIKSYSTQFNVNVLVKIDEMTKDIVVRANQTRIHQIISNLMTNAVKASKSGDDVELICETNCNEKKLVNGVMEQDVIFKVKDRGVGIPKEKQQVIFEPFSQLHNVNESIYPSSGLGLNTVLHNVTSMRGTIHLESDVGKGSEFTVTLPLEIVPSPSLVNSPMACSLEEEQLKKQLTNPGVSESVDIDPSLKKQLSIQENYLKLFATSDRTVVSKNNAQIIIADDNAINRKVIVKLIESLGYETDAVCDGKQLIENIDEKRHKLVFTDINMPNLNGLEAAKFIKAKFKDRIHIVALTGDVLLETPPSIFDSVITKPCRKTTLKKCIESIPSLIACKHDD